MHRVKKQEKGSGFLVFKWVAHIRLFCSIAREFLEITGVDLVIIIYDGKDFGVTLLQDIDYAFNSCVLELRLQIRAWYELGQELLLCKEAFYHYAKNCLCRNVWTVFRKPKENATCGIVERRVHLLLSQLEAILFIFRILPFFPGNYNLPYLSYVGM